METIKAIIKLLAFLATTLFFYFLIVLTSLFSLFGVNYKRARSYLLNKWGRASCYLLQLKLNLQGTAPKPPFFLVSNHLSYLDVFVLFSQVRGVFVAKSDVKSWPFIGLLVRTSGILFIDRKRKRDITRVNRQISENLDQNQGIIMFPESRTSPGLHILPFRSSLLEYPATANLPVTYAVITYSTPAGEEDACKTVCWWADEPFFFHFFNLLKKSEITATVTFGEKAATSADRKKLAQILKKYAQSDFVPVIKPEVFMEQFGALEKGKEFSKILKNSISNNNKSSTIKA